MSILGNPARLDILKYVKRRKYIFLKIIVESRTKLNNQFTGTFEGFVYFKFFFSHHISTIEGGMITTNSKELNDICKSLRAHGWTRDLEKLKNLQKSQMNFMKIIDLFYLATMLDHKKLMELLV